MIVRTMSRAAFACKVKACAPPPVGTGGSSKVANAASRAAAAILARSKAAEPQVTNDLRTVIKSEGGAMVGLAHRVKGLKSLTRKIHDKALSRGQTIEESANRISDALRYTAAFHSKNYTAGVKSTIASLEKKGYKILEKETHWKRGDAYNGVHVIAQHPNGTKVEIQFHTTESLKAKGLTHPLYEKFRQHDTTPQERTRLTREMIRIADSARIPKGALTLGVRVFRPVGA